MRRELTLATRIGIVIVVGMLALTAWAWGQLPAGAEVPTHWNIRGEVDDTSGKAFGFLLIPAISALMIGMMWLVPILEPRAEHLIRSSVAFTTIMVSVIALMFVIQGLLVASALGVDVPMERAMPAAIGLLFVVMGSVMHRMESTYLMGIRTPWTLASERSWKATHRAGRWIFVALGIGLLALAVAGAGETAFLWLFGGLVVTMLGLVVFSFLVWRSDPEREGR